MICTQCLIFVFCRIRKGYFVRRGKSVEQVFPIESIKLFNLWEKREIIGGMVSEVAQSTRRYDSSRCSVRGGRNEQNRSLKIA